MYLGSWTLQVVENMFLTRLSCNLLRLSSRLMGVIKLRDRRCLLATAALTGGRPLGSQSGSTHPNTRYLAKAEILIPNLHTLKIHVHIHICIYIYIYTYAYTYKYAHIYKHPTYLISGYFGFFWAVMEAQCLTRAVALSLCCFWAAMRSSKRASADDCDVSVSVAASP